MQVAKPQPEPQSIFSSILRYTVGLGKSFFFSFLMGLFMTVPMDFVTKVIMAQFRAASKLFWRLLGALKQ